MGLFNNIRERFITSNLGKSVIVEPGSPKDVLEPLPVNTEKSLLESITKKTVDELGIRNKEGNTPLHSAIMNGHLDLAETLVGKMDKEDIFLRNNESKNPLLLIFGELSNSLTKETRAKLWKIARAIFKKSGTNNDIRELQAKFSTLIHKDDLASITSDRENINEEI